MVLSKNSKKEDNEDKFIDEDHSVLNMKNKKIKQFIIDEVNKNYDEICGKTKQFKVKLNNVQRFLTLYFTKQKKLLLYHGIGSGKTITAINIAEQNMKDMMVDGECTNVVYLITKASLIDSFRNELLKWDYSLSGDKYYIESEYNYLYVKKIKERIANHEDLTFKEKEAYKDCKRYMNDKIKSAYKIFSYEKFTKYASRLKLEKNDIIIIDEFTNMVSETSTRYKILYKFLKKYSENPLILLSGTPIYDNYKEFFLSLNLLTPNKPFNYEYFFKLLKNNKKTDEINNMMYKLLKFVRNHISYYEPAKNKKNPIYPSYEIIDEKCQMSEYQTDIYLKVLDDAIKIIPVKLLKKNLRKPEFWKNYKSINSFHLKEKKISNIAITKPIYKNQIFTFYQNKNIKNISCKFIKLVSNLINEIDDDGKMIVYSQFINYYGIASIKKILDANDFYDYMEVIKLIRKNGKTTDLNDQMQGISGDYNNYVCITGKETAEQRQMIQDIFNSPLNADGKIIKIVILSPTANEGLNLFGIRHIHIMELPWNISRLQQIFGRGFRSCGHKFLKPEDRNIKLHLYYSIVNKKKGLEYIKKNKIDSLEDISIDVLLKKILLEKAKQNDIFNNIMKNYAIDCQLFKKSNNIKKCSSINDQNIDEEIKKIIKTYIDNDIEIKKNDQIELF
jgi:hypothetical protein